MILVNRLEQIYRYRPDLDTGSWADNKTKLHCFVAPSPRTVMKPRSRFLSLITTSTL